MDGLLAQLGVSGLIALCGVVGTFYVMRAKIADLVQRDIEQAKEMAAMWSKIEATKETVSLHDQKVGVLSGMLRPDAVAEHTRWQASVTKDVEHLRRDVDELRSK